MPTVVDTQVSPSFSPPLSPSPFPFLRGSSGWYSKFATYVLITYRSILILIYGCCSQRYDHHKDAVYRCAWNPLDPSLIASCSRDGYCVVFKVAEGTVTHRLRMPKVRMALPFVPLPLCLLCLPFPLFLPHHPHYRQRMG